MFFHVIYKSGQIFLPFCHNSRVWRTDGQTDRQTDGQTDRILIARPRLHSMQRGKNRSHTVDRSWTRLSARKPGDRLSGTGRGYLLEIENCRHLVSTELCRWRTKTRVNNVLRLVAWKWHSQSRSQNHSQTAYRDDTITTTLHAKR